MPASLSPLLKPFALVLLGVLLGLPIGWAAKPGRPRAEPLPAVLDALQDRLHGERQALHHAARQAHLAGDPDAARELDGALRELYERHKIRVRAACRERGEEPPGWAAD
jgi:hypothetical protein